MLNATADMHVALSTACILLLTVFGQRRMKHAPVDGFTAVSAFSTGKGSHQAWQSASWRCCSVIWHLSHRFVPLPLICR